MGRAYFDACDVQTAPSVATCKRCRQEIYRYDPVASINGKLVHEDCMTTEEQDTYLTHPACSYFEGAC